MAYRVDTADRAVRDPEELYGGEEFGKVPNRSPQVEPPWSATGITTIGPGFVHDH